MRYRVTITKYLDRDLDDIWGLEEWLENYSDRADGLAAFVEILQEDIGAVVEDAEWKLEELPELPIVSETNNEKESE